MIEHCRDFRRVKKVWDRPIDISRETFYLLEVQDGRDLGVWWFHPCEGGMMIHVAMSEACRGHEAAQSARAAIAWIFNNTDAAAIYASLAPDQRQVRTLAAHVGFEFICWYDGARVYQLQRQCEQKAA